VRFRSGRNENQGVQAEIGISASPLIIPKIRRRSYPALSIFIFISGKKAEYYKRNRQKYNHPKYIKFGKFTEVSGMQRRNILLILALIFIALTGLMLGLLSAKIEQAAENGRALSFEGNYLL
jgi:hypothetical protein